MRNLRIYLLSAVLALSFGTAQAHEDAYIAKDFGNVKVRIKTGFRYEEINKVAMLGQLAERMAERLGYAEQVFLDFEHFYTGECAHDYFISYDKGGVMVPWSDKSNDVFAGEAIVVRQVGRRFDSRATLKLLEYAILNAAEVRAGQQRVEYKENYCNWILNTIDPASIGTALSAPDSEAVRGVMAERVERPDEEFTTGISYFLKDNLYTLFLREPGQPDRELVTLGDIYDFANFDNLSAIAFDSYSSFYFVAAGNPPQVSGRNVMEEAKDCFMPYMMQYLGGDKYSIYFVDYSNEGYPAGQNYIYFAGSGQLVKAVQKYVDRL